MQCNSQLDFNVTVYRNLPTTFFFNNTATTEIYTLSLHDALPILIHGRAGRLLDQLLVPPLDRAVALAQVQDRKSTRLNSSHEWISYAVFCLKKKNMKERVLIRHHYYDQCFHSVQLSQWSSRVKCN